MLLPISAFIFDMDGVITDTAEYHYLSWKRLAEEEGIPFTREENDQLRGLTRRDSLRLLLKGRVIDEVTAQAWMARKQGYFIEYLDHFTPDNRLPGVTRFLQEAQAAGIRLAIGSSSRNVRPVLQKLQLLDAFSVIGDANSVPNNKPAPDIFVWVAGGLRARIEETLVFEDSEAGIDAALKAGFFTVGIGHANVNQAHIHMNDLTDAHVSDILAELEALHHH